MHQVRDEQERPGMPRFLTTLLLGSLVGLAVLLGKHRKIAPKLVPAAGALSPSPSPSTGEAA